MKIKTKKQLNLPQLIEWAFERGAHGVQFKSDRGKRVGFRHMGYFWTECEIDKNDTFTLELEETVTEDTVLPRLITRNIHGGYNEWTNESVNGFNLAHIEAMYIPNDDLTMTLIWTQDKGLAE